ncbi:MAG: alpha-2-macroglobulin family protein, partial [Flavobacteriales bacterium]
DKHELQTNEPVTVTLYDVNYQKVSDLELRTNEYGSFSGTFTAPMGVLNGQMHIGDSHGNMYFSVEEYKRPKFEVQFKPVEGTYRLGDKITAKGNAKSYSGVNVDGAQVKYRVMRYTYFWHWYWWWGGRPNSGDMEITNGETITNEKGDYEVKFDAIPDKAVSSKYQPYYSYTVYADITDINGETHSSTQTIYASNLGFSISMGLSDYTDRGETDWCSLHTRNLNGTDVDAQGTVTIYKLKTPKSVLQDRKLSEPDRHQLTADEFEKTFPFEVYKHENEIERFEKGDKVFSIDFDTKKRDSIEIKGLNKWAPGAYVAEAISKDQWGNEIKETKTFTLFATDVTQLPYPMPFFMRELKNYCEPGDTARFLFGTGFENVRVLYEIAGKKGILKKEWITISNKQQLFEIPILEEHRGNLSVHFNFIYNNRPYTYTSNITVPFTNKELDITFETFRNKLYPGEKEQWKVNIKGKKGEKVAAELMMAMYDASLDAFASNYWYLSIYNSYYGYRNWDNYAGYGSTGTTLYQEDWNDYYGYSSRYFYSLNWFGFYPGYYSYYGYRGSGGYEGDGDYAVDDISESRVNTGKHRMANKKSESNREESPAAELMMDGGTTTKLANTVMEKESSGEYLKGAIGGKDSRETTLVPAGGEDGQNGLGNVQARKNLAETAFFYPQLETDENGNVSVTFTMPEALTKWKVMGLGHTKDLKTGTVTKEILTQKDLMVVPNMPRFLRHGDEMTLVTKISNISEKDLTGDAQLMLFDALSMKPIDDQMDNKGALRSFNVKKAQSTSVSWTIKIPETVEAVTYKVVARSGKFSDGEEAALPVLANRMLVIESMPLHIRKTGEKTFSLTKLLESGGSSTLKSHKLTLEFTDNPAWYAVQALPYIMEYPYECAEQTFARFYANSIATHVVNSSPKIKTVFETWKNSSPETFLSNLHKNQELKSVMLEETPWVMEANDESERKKRIALLFDFNRMSNELDAALRKLQKSQVSNGGWPWFPGMPESRYITQHIITGMGHLDKLGIKNVREESRTWNMVKNGVRYLDNRIEEDYRYIKKHYKDYKTEQYISYDHVQYMYARSYF